MSNKFPQLEWISVDGRQVPVPKIQHYKKGSTTETELTGHDNPFPVANYTQDSNGLWLPVSADNPVPTRLTGSIVGLDSLQRGISHNKYLTFTHVHDGADATDVIKTTEPCVVMSLSFTTNDSRAYPQIYIYDENGIQQLLYIARGYVPASPTTGTMSPDNLNLAGGGTEILENVLYDKDKNKYIIGLKEPLYCPTGLRLRSVGRVGEEVSVAISAQVVFFA